MQKKTKIIIVVVGVIILLLSFWGFFKLGKIQSTNETRSIPNKEPKENFILVMERPKSQSDQEFSDLSTALERIVKSTNNILPLSGVTNPIPIRFKQCGQINAFYDPNTIEITICHELYEELKSTEEARSTAVLVMSFFLWHEIGHALIDIYSLNTTGREEDVADQFAFYILTKFKIPGIETMLPVAINISSWMLEAPQNITLEVYADTHALTTQRAINFMCWTYGGLLEKDYDRTSTLNELIPANRLPYCKEEYDQIIQSWPTLLAPYTTAEYR